MPKTQLKYQMKMPSQSENLAIIREAVSKIAAQAGFDTDDVSKIELAVDEACANVIKHAYDKGNSKKLIEVLIKIDKNKLMVVVTDKGKGFNPSDIKLPKMREYLKEMRVGGLGIYLIETLMDKVNFDLKPGIKNQVKMIKYINKKSANSTNLPN